MEPSLFGQLNLLTSLPVTAGLLKIVTPSGIRKAAHMVAAQAATVKRGNFAILAAQHAFSLVNNGTIAQVGDMAPVNHTDRSGGVLRIE